MHGDIRLLWDIIIAAFKKKRSSLLQFCVSFSAIAVKTEVFFADVSDWEETVWVFSSYLLVSAAGAKPTF